MNALFTVRVASASGENGAVVFARLTEFIVAEPAWMTTLTGGGPGSSLTKIGVLPVE
jgi:hypothetical protein